MVARANLIFGLHVHVGIEDRETLIHLMNQMRYFLPHLLALSTNSPFWIGMNTGLKSYRCKVFDRFPRTNIPDTFTSWADFEGFVNLLVRTNCIDNAKKIWWDIRPHPVFTTLEIRVCDIPMRVEETLALAALIQATAVKLYRLHEQQPELAPVQPRAPDGKQVARRPLRHLRLAHRLRPRDGSATNARSFCEYLAWVDDVLDELDSREAGRTYPLDSRPRHGRRSTAGGLGSVGARPADGRGFHDSGDEARTVGRGL